MGRPGFAAIITIQPTVEQGLPDVIPQDGNSPTRFDVLSVDLTTSLLHGETIPNPIVLELWSTKVGDYPLLDRFWPERPGEPMQWVLDGYPGAWSGYPIRQTAEGLEFLLGDSSCGTNMQFREIARRLDREPDLQLLFDIQKHMLGMNECVVMGGPEVQQKTDCPRDIFDVVETVVWEMPRPPFILEGGSPAMPMVSYTEFCAAPSEGVKVSLVNVSSEPAEYTPWALLDTGGAARYQLHLGPDRSSVIGLGATTPTFPPVAPNILDPYTWIEFTVTAPPITGDYRMTFVGTSAEARLLVDPDCSRELAD